MLYLIALPVDPRDDVLTGGVLVAELGGVERPADLLGNLATLGGGGATKLSVLKVAFGGSNRLENVHACGVDAECSAQFAVLERRAGEHLLVGVRVQTFAIQSGHLSFGDNRPGGG